jgi:hypothetical protein
MTENESMKKITVSFPGENVDPGVPMSLPEAQLEEIEKLQENYDLPNRSVAIRIFVQIGMNSMVTNDPRNKSRDDQSSSTKIKDFIPEGEENSISLKSGEENSLIDKIDSEILEIVRNDPEIQLDGWEVYK